MQKIVNWLLPVFVIIGAVLDGCFSLIQEAIVAFGMDKNYTIIIRIIIVAIGVVSLKLQPPSLKKKRIIKAKK